MYISHQYYIPVHVALKSQSFLGVKSHHFSLPYICISIVVVLGMFRYGFLYIFRGEGSCGAPQSREETRGDEGRPPAREIREGGRE
jgi:hypothetical protein